MLDMTETILRKKNTGEAGNGGQFGTHTHTADTIELAAPNKHGWDGVWPGLWDANDSDDRPMRPYLPLRGSDDDEFFDTPRGTVVTMVGTNERLQLTGEYEWTRVNLAGDLTDEKISAGELWADICDGEVFGYAPNMKPSRLDLPLGVLYSDKTGYTDRSRADKPISKAEAARRFTEEGAEFTVVSQSGYDLTRGVYKGGRVGPRLEAPRKVVSAKPGNITWDSGSKLTIDANDEVFERHGGEVRPGTGEMKHIDIVIRSKQEYGVETVYRRTA